MQGKTWICKRYPQTFGWWGWVEAFCSYILGNGPQRALQNQYSFKTHPKPIKLPECHFSTKWQSPTPLFWRTFTKNPLYKMTILSTHQSASPFHPVILTGKKTPKAFCRQNSWQPRDTSGYFYWILGVYWRHVVARWLTCCSLPWRYKMTNLQVLETSTSTKWQPRVVFQLPTLQSHNSTTPTQKQHVPTQKTYPRSAVGKGCASCHLA